MRPHYLGLLRILSASAATKESGILHSANDSAHAPSQIKLL
jgi:hypothetical protein